MELAVTGLALLSLVAFVCWVYTVGVWYHALRRANGHRPLISAMLYVGSITTVMAFLMLNVVVNPDVGFTLPAIIAAYGYRLCLLGVCWSMFDLHRRIVEIDITGHTGRTDDLEVKS